MYMTYKYEEKKMRSHVWVYQYRESGGEDAIELFSQIPTRSQLNEIILENLGIDAEALRTKGETLGLNDCHEFHEGQEEEYVKGERETYIENTVLKHHLGDANPSYASGEFFRKVETIFEPEFYENLCRQEVRGEE